MRQIRPIVPIEEWLNDPFYVGKEVKYIRPYVRDFLVSFFKQGENPLREFICTGASRTGKTYAIVLLVVRIIYEVSCYEEFPTGFDLSPTTLPKIVWFAFSKGKASSVGIKRLMRVIDQIPYFQDPSIRRKDIESEIIFPFLEIISGSQVEHAIGEDLLGAVIDEANVQRVAKGSEVQAAENMFKEIRQRSVMTFSKNGLWGGFSGIISSSGSATSFVAQELDKAKKENDAVIMEAAVYTANPSQYSKETFDVFYGNGTVSPFIVDSCPADIAHQINTTYGMTVDMFLEENSIYIEKVPVSIRKFYEEDLLFSLMNMSGKTMTGTNFFITNKKWIKQMWSEELHPLSKPIPEIGIYDTDSIFVLYDAEMAFRDYGGQNVYIHVDASQKWDCTGFSALYYDQDAGKIKSLLTCSFTINRNIMDNQIDQEKIMQLILLLKENGAVIKLITGDHYARDYLIPQCKKRFGNECSDYFSVDVNSNAHAAMLNYMKRNMYSMPKYGRLEYELDNLLLDNFTQTVDHPHNTDSKNPIYFKDCSDCVAAASYHIYIMEKVEFSDISSKEAEEVDLESDDFYSSINVDEEWNDNPDLTEQEEFEEFLIND